ncbi:MAG: hypothetical protein ABW278_06980 [Steroidobacteraceae bacterium]
MDGLEVAAAGHYDPGIATSMELANLLVLFFITVFVAATIWKQTGALARA